LYFLSVINVLVVSGLGRRKEKEDKIGERDPARLKQLRAKKTVRFFSRAPPTIEIFFYLRPVGPEKFFKSSNEMHYKTCGKIVQRNAGLDQAFGYLKRVIVTPAVSIVQRNARFGQRNAINWYNDMQLHCPTQCGTWLGKTSYLNRVALTPGIYPRYTLCNCLTQSL
jgi:hypothetical protein